MTRKRTTLKVDKNEEKKDEVADTVQTTDANQPKTDPHANVLRSGTCPKLSPKSTDKLEYQIALNSDDQELYIRIAGNSGGGLFSKAWIKMEDVFTVLDKEKDKVIKSAALRPVMKGGSANNCGFMSAILREIHLLEPSPASIFSHQLASGYENVKAELRGMSGEGKGTKPDTKPKAEPETSPDTTN